MKKNKKTNNKWIKKRNRIKSSLKIGSLPRLVVYRSNKNIFAQIIDDLKSETIVSVSSIDKSISSDVKKAKTKLEKSVIVGKKIGSLAAEKKISKVIFDRNGYNYHGRIKALADAAREVGMKF